MGVMVGLGVDVGGLADSVSLGCAVGGAGVGSVRVAVGVAAIVAIGVGVGVLFGERNIEKPSTAIAHSAAATSAIPASRILL
jgi:hypothetical protein